MPRSLAPALGKGFLVASLAALGATVALTPSEDDPFRRFFGGVPPLLGVGLAGAVGAASLHLLHRRRWGLPAQPDRTTRGIRRAVPAAIGFAAVPIALDLLIGFREDLNTPWPESVPFYLSIGFVAEVAFHLVPLALVATVAGRRFDASSLDRRVAIAIAAVAAIEAVIQALNTLATGDTALALLVGAHVYAFGLCSLLIFWAFGFVPMLAFRLAYYALWHVAWGALRLHLLF